MTYEEAKRLYDQHGSHAKAARAAGCAKSTIQKMLQLGLGRSALVTPAKPTPVEVSPAIGGFSLSGKKLLAVKPTDVWKARFHSLRRGMGYTLEALSEEWGNSVDTIQAKARRFGALRYVEDPSKPGAYIACAVHPETPKGK